MRRKIFSIFLGLFAGFITFAVSHVINSWLHPVSLPAEVDIQDPEQLQPALQKAMKSLPTSYFVTTLACHGFAVFVASFVSSLFRGYAWLTAALVPAAMFMMFSLIVMSRLPPPDWFRWADLSIYFPSGFFGYLLALALIGTSKQNEQIPEPTAG